MDEQGLLAEQFETHRRRLRGIAYRMLGSPTEAEDAVQEAWIRISRTDESEIDNLGAWLTTVVARVCLNMLRARKARHEEFPPGRVPEPIIDRPDGMDPEHEALLGDSLGLALLVLLETLAPAERVAFVLHDVFALPFEEIAPDPRPDPDGHQAAGKPGTTPRARGRPGSRSGPARPANGRRCVHRRRPQRRLRGPDRGARPGCRPAGRRRRTLAGSHPGDPRSRDGGAIGSHDHATSDRLRCAARARQRRRPASSRAMRTVSRSR